MNINKKIINNVAHVQPGRKL